MIILNTDFDQPASERSILVPATDPLDIVVTYCTVYYKDSVQSGTRYKARIRMRHLGEGSNNYPGDSFFRVAMVGNETWQVGIGTQVFGDSVKFGAASSFALGTRVVN